MDSTGEGIVLPTKIDLSGFSKGTKQLESAIKSLSGKVKSIGNTTERMASKMASPLKRILPTILGVGSAYQILSKSVSAFLSQNEELSARMSSIWTALGNLLGPIITQIIDWVTTAVSYFLSFLKLLGVTSKSASELSQKANKSTKELQRTLAGFDELNVLQDNQNGGSGNNGNLKDIDPSEWMQKLAELLKNKMWDDAADMIIEKLNDILYKVRDKAYDVGKKIGEYFGGIIHVIARVLDETDWKALGQGIARFINGLFEDVDGEDIGKILVAKLTIAFKMLTGFLEDLNYVQLADKISGIIIGALDSITKAIKGADFNKIGEGIRTFFTHIDWKWIAISIGELLSAAWNGAVDFFSGLLGVNIREKLVDPIKKAFEPLVSVFSENGSVWYDSFLKIANTIGEVLGYTGSTMIEVIPKFLTEMAKGLSGLPSSLASIVDSVGKLWKDAILPMLTHVADSGIVEAFFKALSTLIDTCANTLEAVLPHLISFVNDFMTPLVSVVTQLATLALDEITKWLNNFNSTTVGALSFAEQINLIGTEWNGLVGYIKDGVGDADYYLQTFAGRFDTLAASMELGTREFEDASAISEEYADKIRELGEEFSKTAYESANEEEAERKRKEILDQLNVVVDDYTKALAEAGYTIDEHGKIVEVATQKTEEFSEATQKSSTATSGTINDLHDFAEYLNKVSEMKFDNFELYNETLKQLATTLGITTDELKEQINAAGGDATQIEALKNATAGYLVQMAQSGQLTSGYVQSLREQGIITEDVIRLMREQGVIIKENGEVIADTANATENSAKAVEAMASSEKEAAQAVKDTNDIVQQVPGTTEEASEGYSDFGESAKDTTDETKATTEDMVKILETDWDALGETVTGQATAIKDTVISAITSMRDSVVPMFQSMAQGSTGAVNELYQGVSVTFSTLVSNSFGWGYDMMANLSNGIVRGFNELVEPTMQRVVEVIRQYIHFSKPDKGALADFDEYGPDMMKLFAEGIESEKSRVVAAIDDVAESVAGKMNGGELQMPVVAGGGFLPYNVGSQGVGSVGGGEINSEILAAVLQLQELITQFENSVNNMQWVARFGNVRAIVEEITKLQRQTDRAKG